MNGPQNNNMKIRSQTNRTDIKGNLQLSQHPSSRDKNTQICPLPKFPAALLSDDKPYTDIQCDDLIVVLVTKKEIEIISYSSVSCSSNK